MPRPFYRIFNTGTPEGVKKSWETRRSGLSGKYIDHSHYKVSDQAASALAEGNIPRHGYERKVNIPADMKFLHRESSIGDQPGNWSDRKMSTEKHDGTGWLSRTPLSYHDGKNIDRGWAWALRPNWNTSNWPVVGSR